MAKIKITEEEVASVTSLLFKHWGYDLYPETQLSCFGGRPDLVGVKGKSWCSVIECKAKLSYEVLEQVCRWHMEKEHFKGSDWYQKNPDPSRTAIPHFLWVATGNSASSKLHDMKRFLLDKFRIGWIDIEVLQECPQDLDIDEWYCTKQYPDNKLGRCSSSDYGHIRIGRRVYEYRIKCEALIQEGSRKSAHHIIDCLYPEMKQATAGVTADKANYMTPFKLTLHKTVQFMEEGKAYTTNDLLKGVPDHHYSKDSGYTSSIGGWLIKFGHAELVGEGYHKKLKLIPK